jgi:hypothetical protein
MTSTTKNWKDIAEIDQGGRGDDVEVHVQYPTSHSGTKLDHIGIIQDEGSIAIRVESIPALIEALLKAQQHIEDRANGFRCSDVK